tara:strand:+ start:89 stop:916 length:828 start_codon:yes stop_codon:yes gene_type:complete
MTTKTRMNWNLAFTTLIGSVALQGKDRTVIESMHAHWSRGKSMTVGRKQYFLAIQERTQRAAVALQERATGDGETTMGKRLFALQERMGEEGTQWDQEFVESVAVQEVQGRTLSARQIQILEGIEVKFSDESQNAAKTFVEDFESNKDNMRTNFERMIAYYIANPPYYRNAVRSQLSDPQWIPTAETYNKVMGSAYTIKVLSGYTASPKYTVGALVFANAKLPHNAAMWMLKGAMVMSTSGAIISACKNNKLYTLLPIGGTTTIQVEERYLKARR